MRPRAKSMFQQRTEITFITEDKNWPLEDKIKIIGKLKEQIPLRDSIPFDQRLQSIDWDKIEVNSLAPSDIKNQFYLILNSVRTYRVLPEILKDLERKLLSQLPIKKPLSAFSLFLQDNKKTITQQNIKNDESFTRTAASIYRTLTKDERERLENKSDKIKQEYQELITKLNINTGSYKKFTKDVPHSPLHKFWLKKRKLEPNMTFREARTEYAALEPEHKLNHILKYLDVIPGEMLSFEQYKKAKETFMKDEMILIDDYEKKPKILTAYNLYMKKYLSSSKPVTDGKWNSVFKNGVESWKNLKQKEKSKYIKKAKELKEGYNKKYEEYVNSLSRERQAYLKKPLQKNKNNSVSNTDLLVSDDVDCVINDSPQKKRSIHNEEDYANDSEFTSPSTNTGGKKKRHKQTTESTSNEFESLNDDIDYNSKPPKHKKKKNIEDDNHNNSSIAKIEPKMNPEDGELTPAKKKKTDKKGKTITPKETQIAEEQIIVTSDIKIETEQEANLEQHVIRKPPRSLYAYFVLYEYKGPRYKSKKAFKALKKEDVDQLQESFNKCNRKYLRKFRKYVSTLQPNAFATDVKKIYEERNIDESISDITEEDL